MFEWCNTASEYHHQAYWAKHRKVLVQIVWCVFVCYTEWWVQLYICWWEETPPVTLIQEEGAGWFGMVFYDMTWHGMAWYGKVWYGMVWKGWYSMVWTPPVLLIQQEEGWRTDNTQQQQIHLAKCIWWPSVFYESNCQEMTRSRSPLLWVPCSQNSENSHVSFSWRTDDIRIDDNSWCSCI